MDDELVNALQTIKKNNFRETEVTFKKEAGLDTNKTGEELQTGSLDELKSFITIYKKFVEYIETAPQRHRLEMSSLLFPVFVIMYLKLVDGNYFDEAKSFMHSFRRFQVEYYQQDINVLSMITGPNSMVTNTLIECFKNNDFNVSVVSESYNIIDRFIREHKLTVIQNILKDQINIELVDGPPRTRRQLDCRRGATFGESRRDDNKEPILYGLLMDYSIECDDKEALSYTTMPSEDANNDC